MINIFFIVSIATMIYCTTMGTKYIIELMDMHRQKHNNDFVFTYIGNCEKTLTNIVLGVYKDVDIVDLKEYKKAFNLCGNKLIDIMGAETPYIINSMYSNYDKWLKIQIESILAQR